MVVINGDINIRLDRATDPHTIKFTALLSSFGLVQHVSQSTHSQGGTLDVVIMRDDQQLSLLTVRDVGISDHSFISWCINIAPPPLRYRSVSRRDRKNFNNDLFVSELAKSALCSTQRSASDLDPNTLSTIYDTTVTDLLDTLAPVKCVQYRERPSNIWFDDECRNVKVKTRALEKRFRLTNDQTDNRKYYYICCGCGLILYAKCIGFSTVRRQV